MVTLRDSFGSIRFVDQPTIRSIASDDGGSGTYRVQAIEWHPPERYSQHLPTDFSISLEQVVGRDNVRRFQPVRGDWRAHIMDCFIAGVAILQELGQLPVDHRSIRSLRFHAYIWTKYRQEYSRRRFQYGRDIHVRTNSRVDSRVTNVISELSGLHDAMSRVGSVRAMAETRSQDRARRFHDGLYRIALDFDFPEVSELDIENILRSSLIIHRHPLPVLTAEQLFEVTERFQHLIDLQNDLSPSDFTEWLTSSSTNLPTRIARRNGSVEIDRTTAKAGLFELGWLGMNEASVYINATMRTIANLCCLDDDERRIFDSLYAPRPELNNLVPILFLDRHDFLAPAMVDIWCGRSIDEVMPAIRTLLYFYGQMANSRRVADRVGSSRNSAQNVAGAIASHTTVSEELTARPELSERIQARLVEALELQCPNCESTRLRLDYALEADCVQVLSQCNECSQVSESIYSVEQLGELLDEDDFAGDFRDVT